MLSPEQKDRLRRVRCFLLDMDGTFYLGDRLIDGSLAFLDCLRHTGRSAMFLTNNSSKSAKVYLEKLRRLGVGDPFLNVYTSGMAAARYLLARFGEKPGFLLGNEMLRAELTEAGLRFDSEDPAWVLAAFDTTLDYAKMTRVCDLVRAGLPYIATHPDFNCPTETGFIPDLGAIMAFIKASTGRDADVIIGKPYRGIVDGALDRVGQPADACAMVGDRLYTDIATGVNFGMTSILVLSGEATAEDLRVSPVQPHLVFDRLADMIPILEG